MFTYELPVMGTEHIHNKALGIFRVDRYWNPKSAQFNPLQYELP